MFTFTSASTRLVTDTTQTKSRVFLWMAKDGGMVPMLGKDRHLARTAIREALSMYGFPPSVIDRLEWVPRCADCFHPHYIVEREFPLRNNNRMVDLHVRMK